MSQYTYYLDTTNPTSTDINPCTFTQPCRTLGHLNDLGPQPPPGSVVYLKTGSHFYETLAPQASGITYTSYGLGPQPIIDASQAMTTSWTQPTGVQIQESQPSGGFASGFEASGFTDWTQLQQIYGSAATLTQSTAVVHDGTHSAMLTGDGIGNTVILSKTINPWNANNTYWIRVYINVPVGAITPNKSLRPLTFSSSYNDFLNLQSDSSGNMTSVGLLLGGTYVGGGAMPNLADGNWHYIDVGLKPAAAAAGGGSCGGVGSGGGGGEVWVDGMRYVCNYTSIDTSTAASNMVIQLGNTGYNSVLVAGSHIYFDDFLYNAANGRAGPANLPTIPTTAWATPFTTNPYGPMFGANYGHQVSNVSLVTNPYDWYWDGATTLYVYGTTSPSGSVSLPNLTYAAIVSGYQNITFNNLDFRGAKNILSGQGQISLTNASGFTMTNSTCEEAYSFCLELYDGATLNQNITIGGPSAGNVFQNNGGGGVGFNSSYQTNNYIGYNTFNVNCLNSYSPDTAPTAPGVANQDLIYCGLFKGYSQYANDNGPLVSPAGQGTIIEWNTLTSSAPALLANGWAGSAAGIWPDTVNGYTIRYNTISGMFSSGIRLERTGGSFVYGNTIFGNDTPVPPPLRTTAGIDVLCGQGISAYGNQIFNNSIYGSNWGMSANPDNTCVFSYNVFTNNVMSGSTGGTELYTSEPADNTSYGAGGTGNSYTYNNFGVDGAICWVVYGPASTSSPPTNCRQHYADFDMAVGSTTHTIQGDPMFTSPSTGNLTLQTGSPAIGAGTLITNFYGPHLNLGVQ